MNFKIIIAVFFACIGNSFSEEEYQKWAVKENNRLRALHGSNPLVHDEALAKIAADCATDYAKRKEIDHKCFEKYKNKYGEILTIIYDPFDPMEFMKISMGVWYGENVYYNYEDPSKNPKNDPYKRTGHFVHMIWDGIKKMGCAVKTVQNITAASCMYDPSGGQLGFPEDVYKFYKKNVRRPKH